MPLNASKIISSLTLGSYLLIVMTSSFSYAANNAEYAPVSQGGISSSSVSSAPPILNSASTYVHLYYGVKPPRLSLVTKLKSEFPELKLILIKYKERYRLLGVSENPHDYMSRVSASHILDTEPFLWKWSGLPNDNSTLAIQEPSASDKSTVEYQPSELERKIATAAISLGQIGKSDDKSGTVKGMLKSYVEDEGNKALQDALSYFGTAEVGMELDDDFHLSNGHAELLVPFGGDSSSTFFAQGGVVLNSEGQYSGRDFAHLGIGYRSQQNSELMYGVNAFYDFDMKRKHQRASLGGEVWFQNYKLSGNYYFPISGWKESQEQLDNVGLYDLNERAARGVDIKGEGYLPQAPSVSADIGVGATFGRLVEVSDGSTPVSNPYKVSANINYQPIPLVRLSSGYSYEKGRGGEGTLGLNFTYNFGQSLSEQLKSSNVAQTKVFSHQMRTSMVARNNNISLEYKENKFAFMLKKHYLEVDEGSMVHASSLVRASGLKNVESFEMVVQGSWTPSSRARQQRLNKLTSEYIKDLHYFFGPITQTTKTTKTFEVMFIAHLKGGATMKSDVATIVVQHAQASDATGFLPPGYTMYLDKKLVDSNNLVLEGGKEHEIIFKLPDQSTSYRVALQRCNEGEAPPHDDRFFILCELTNTTESAFLVRSDHTRLKFRNDIIKLENIYSIDGLNNSANFRVILPGGASAASHNTGVLHITRGRPPAG